MVTRIIALFNLRAGISREQYEAWARAIDLPTVNALSSVEKFEVFRATGALGKSELPYQYIETIDVASEQSFYDELEDAPMKAIAERFADFADCTFIVTQRL